MIERLGSVKAAARGLECSRQAQAAFPRTVATQQFMRLDPGASLQTPA